MLVLVIFFVTLGFTSQVEEVSVKSPSTGKEELDICPLCVDTLTNIMQGLMDVIVDVGILGGCDVLCAALPVPGMVKEVCVVLCEVVGVEGFVDLLKKADLDPIWMCQEMKVCPIHDCTLGQCAEIIDCLAHPPHVYDGQWEKMSFAVKILDEEIGTGSFDLQIVAPEGSNPAGFNDYQVQYAGWKNETYSYEFQLQMDPNQYDFWEGVFQVRFVICEGMCGSAHPHSRYLAECATQFNYSVVPKEAMN